MISEPGHQTSLLPRHRNLTKERCKWTAWRDSRNGKPTWVFMSLVVKRESCMAGSIYGSTDFEFRAGCHSIGSYARDSQSLHPRE
jgi:hypothetical protein